MVSFYALVLLSFCSFILSSMNLSVYMSSSISIFSSSSTISLCSLLCPCGFVLSSMFYVQQWSRGLSGWFPTKGTLVPTPRWSSYFEWEYDWKNFFAWWENCGNGKRTEKIPACAWKLSYCGTHCIGQDLPTPFISTYIGKVDFILPWFM